MTKVCSKCGKEKDGSEFSKSEPHSKGLNSWCKECMAIYHKTHNATPEMVAKRRAKQSTQEFKDARRERNATTEAKASRKEYLDRYNATPEANARKRASNLKANYGITQADYDALLAAQNGICAICGADKPGSFGGKNFHVDHDHNTNKIRALLCSNCNHGLGKFKDDPDLLISAANYLIKFRNSQGK